MMMMKSSSIPARSHNKKMKKKGVFLGGPPPQVPMHPIRSSMQLGHASVRQKFNSDDP